VGSPGVQRLTTASDGRAPRRDRSLVTPLAERTLAPAVEREATAAARRPHALECLRRDLHAVLPREADARRVEAAGWSAEGAGRRALRRVDGA
jgi:hypothetical protein